MCLENRGTSAATAIRRTTFDQVHKVSGSAWLRCDSDNNSGPRARLIVAHPDLPEAARWYLENGKSPRQRGIGRIKERYAYTCVNPECAARSLRLHVHHRTPRSKGGSDAKENLDPLCPACHLRLRHSGHLAIERHGDRLVFTFADREITMFGYSGIA